MPSEPDRRERLAWRAILDNCLLAQSFCATLSAADFAADRKTFYAVTRCLEIVSEAARRLRGAQQADHPSIRWRQIEDSGNVFRHVYQNVAESRVWAIVHGELNDLIAAAVRSWATSRCETITQNRARVVRTEPGGGEGVTRLHRYAWSAPWTSPS